MKLKRRGHGGRGRSLQTRCSESIVLVVEQGLAVSAEIYCGHRMHLRCTDTFHKTLRRVLHLHADRLVPQRVSKRCMLAVITSSVLRRSQARYISSHFIMTFPKAQKLFFSSPVSSSRIFDRKLVLAHPSRVVPCPGVCSSWSLEGSK